VLHVITGLGVGGAESMLASLVGARPKGLDQAVVSLVPDGFHAGRLRELGLRVTELALNRTTRVAGDLMRLAGILRDERPDVVQGWMYHGNLAAMIALAMAGRRQTTRLVWGIRCSDRTASLEPWTLRAVIRAGAPFTRFTDMLVANSQAGLDYHADRGYHAPRSLVIHNGIDSLRYRPDPQVRAAIRHALALRPDDVVLAHVARVHPMKDHATFVQVVRSLPNVRALAVGVGTEALPDVPNLKRLGRRSDVPDLLAASDIIVSSSAYGEGFSNALAEGMAAGLVPVSTNVGDARVIVGDTGIVTPIRSESALREAIASLAALPRQELAQRGARARERIANQFSLDRAIGEFTRLYVELAAHGPHGSA
jgi:glycosyltransferase involved in cell wall biosynthesis